MSRVAGQNCAPKRIKTSLSNTISAAKRKRGERARQDSSTHSVGCSNGPFSSVPESLISHYYLIHLAVHIDECIAGQESANHCVVAKGKSIWTLYLSLQVSLGGSGRGSKLMVMLFDVSRQSGSTLLEHIQAYNNALALASLGCNEVCMQGFSPRDPGETVP